MDKSIFEYKQLAKDCCNYKYSTAKFYEMGIKDFLFIKDLRDEFGKWFVTTRTKARLLT